MTRAFKAEHQTSGLSPDCKAAFVQLEIACDLAPRPVLRAAVWEYDQQSGSYAWAIEMAAE